MRAGKAIVQGNSSRKLAQGRKHMHTRREMLHYGLAASTVAALALKPEHSVAQALSSLQIFVPAAPGGGWDQTARAVEHAMRTDGIIKEFRIEHAPGAGGAVGLPKFLATKKGQGDALMVGGMVMVGALIANKSPVKMTDLTPIARLTGEAQVVVVPAASPHKSMADLITAFKAAPGKVSWAGGSAGGTDHILAGMIARASGVDPKAVSYVAYSGGGPAQAALLGNQVTAGISGWGEFAEQVKAGKLRALAISSDKRQAGVDVPTLKEQGVDVVLFNWRSLFAAPGTTADQQNALIGVVDRMVKGPAWKAELKNKDWTDIYLPGAEFGKFLGEEITRITGILKDLGLAT
jgi:putative tricarboxylic transport membrane protein